jgi:Uma2 family endonuclease
MPTLDSVLEPLERIEIVLPSTSDTRDIFRQVAEVYEGRKVELTEEGHIVVMAPTGLEGGYLSGEVFGQLREWAKRTGIGKAFDASAGFYITQQQNRSPDAAWVKNARIESIPKKHRKAFAPFCPDFAIEVKSPSDNLSELQSKCLTYVRCGAGEAWLIDPERKTVWVYTAGSDKPAELHDVDSVQASGPLESFVLDLTPIWAGL